MKFFLKVSLLAFLASCGSKKAADLIVINANVYTVNPQFDKAEAFAVKDGKFIGVGSSEDIINTYAADSIVDVEGKTIVPGFIDAHCHFYRMGLGEQEVKLEGTKSYDEVIARIVDFNDNKHPEFITGRGWDQNDWPVKEFPTKDKLDSLFPNTPVAVSRIDGHALLVNQAALDLSGLTDNSEIEGGEIIKKDGKLTGVLLDAAMGPVFKIVPPPSIATASQALKDAERICLDYGLTTVDEAGLYKPNIDLIDSLQKAGDMHIRVYAMPYATDENLDYYLKQGPTETNRLHIKGFKYVADGALGSRGATMRKPYSDRPGHYGTLTHSYARLQEVAKRIAASDFQMNSHAIGDSANHIVLNTYKSVLNGEKGRRWRVEHAQILSPEDFKLFDDIIPSVQPTHATSDMYWAEDRVGPDRIKNGYAYKELLDTYGKVALGTDFPVEKVSPFLTFYAAVARKDLQGYPEGGFQMENALSREETLKGMTIWAAYSNFEENEKGSIESGKLADFIVLDKDIMSVDIDEVPNIKVLGTFIDGVAR